MNKSDIDLLSEYYQHELSYLRSAGSEFAARFPKIARRLDLSHNESTDPHVERMIESFAFLSGKLQKQIDDQFPEIATALLDVLYSPILLPMPSCMMINFDVDPARASKSPGFTVPKHTLMYATSHSGEKCSFTTSHDLQLWPVKITGASIVQKEHIPGYYARSVYYLKIELKYSGVAKSKTPQKLRFYMHADALLRGKIFSAIFSTEEKVLFQKDKSFEFLSSISPVGLEQDDALLPYPSSVFSGFRLLQEYFAFGEKFFGFDIDIPKSVDINGETSLYIPMSYDISMRISGNNFSLSSVPAINLFRKVSEPLRLEYKQVEYCLVADYRRYYSNEIYSIEKITATDSGSTNEIFVPEFFSCNHSSHDDNNAQLFWKSKRKKSYMPDAFGEDIYLSFIDMDFNPQFPADKVFYAHTMCTNRGVAEQIPVNGLLQMELSAPVNAIYCVDRPTPQKPPVKTGDILWKLISALSLNSISFNKDGIQKIKEVLDVFADATQSPLDGEINSIMSIDCNITTKRIGDQTWCGFIRGTEVEITFDEFISNLGLPLSMVIAKFLSSYTSINTFTEVSVQNISRNGILKKWNQQFGVKRYL
jgi:type VI secretion system protein ImpG